MVRSSALFVLERGFSRFDFVWFRFHAGDRSWRARARRQRGGCAPWLWRSGPHPLMTKAPARLL